MNLQAGFSSSFLMPCRCKLGKSPPTLYATGDPELAAAILTAGRIALLHEASRSDDVRPKGAAKSPAESCWSYSRKTGTRNPEAVRRAVRNPRAWMYSCLKVLMTLLRKKFRRLCGKQ